MISSQVFPPGVFQRLINSKLNSTMTIPYQTYSSSSIKPSPPLRLKHLSCSMPHTFISALRSLIRAQHSGLEHPYRIRRERNYRPRYPRRKEVIHGSEYIPAFRARNAVGACCIIYETIRSMAELNKLRFND